MVELIAGEDLDQILSRLAKKPDPETDGSGRYVVKVWVTEVTQCLMWSFYERTGAARDESREIFLDYVRRLGRSLHAAFEARLGGETEVSVVKTIEDDDITVVLRGRADMVWRDTVIEFKTYTTARPLTENPGHIAQLAFYMVNLPARRGLLMYASRVRPELRAYLFDMEDEDDRSLIEEMERLVTERARIYARWLVGLEEPSPEPGRQCNYCPFHLICKKRRTRDIPSLAAVLEKHKIELRVRRGARPITEFTLPSS